MADAASAVAHTTTRLYDTRTRQAAVNYQLPSEDEDEEPSSTQGSTGSWYAIKEIIAEKPGRYKVLWEGLNPDTGEPWPADWIRKRDVSAASVLDWAQKKKQRAANKGPRADAAAGAAQPKQKRSWSAATSGQGIRLKRIELLVTDTQASEHSEYQPTQRLTDATVDSSPLTPPPPANRLAQQGRDEIEDSIDGTSSTSPPQTDLFIELSQLSSAFDRDSYSQYSDLASSQPESLNQGSGQGSSHNNTSLLPATGAIRPPFDRDTVIPDSQPNSCPSQILSSATNTTRNSIPSRSTAQEIDDSIQDGAQPCSQRLDSFGERGDSPFDNFSFFLTQPQSQLSTSKHHSGITDPPPGPSKPSAEAPSHINTSTPIGLSLPEELYSPTLSPPPPESQLPFSVDDHDIPFLSLSGDQMAEQPQTPPPGSPASSSGKLSLRERLAQTRKPFNDAVSAFKATPTRVESPSGRGSPVLSSQASFPGTPTPAPADSSQAAAVAIGSDVSPSIKPTQAPGNMPPPQSTQSTPLFTAQNTLQSIPDAQPRPLLPFSQPLSHVTLASQLHNSFAAFPESDHEFSPSQAVISQINAYELPTRPKFSKGEYALVLALSDGQKKAYLQNINNKAKIIQRFCEGEQNDNETTSIIRNVLSTAACVSTHLDLTSNDSIDWEQTEVGYALLHPKFQFLKTFLDSLRQQNMLVAICAQPGKTLDLLELFLRGIKVRCRRTDGFSSRPPLAFDEVNGLVSVALLATGPDNSRVVGNYASIVIAFDSTFDINEKHVVNYRTHTLEVGRLSPVLRLISINTVEHVKLYISPRNNANYLNQLMSFVAILRDQAGVLPSSITGNATTDALDMAKSIIRMSEAGGETLQLPEIPALPLYEPASQTSSQQTSVLASQASEAPVARTQPVKPVAVDSQPIQHAGEKRRWQETSTEQETRTNALDIPDRKRRLVAQVPASSEVPAPKPVQQQPQPPSTQGLGDITHVSDSQPDPSPIPLATDNSRGSMDIDRPESTEQPQALQPTPVDNQQHPTQNQPSTTATTATTTTATTTEETNANPVTLPIRGKDGEVEEPAVEKSQDAMEEVVEKSQDAMEGVVEKSQDAMEGVVENTNQITNEQITNELIVNTPEPMDESTESEEEFIGEIDQDDFEYPVFNAPGNATNLSELDREGLMATLVKKIKEFDDWVHSTSRLQLRFEDLRAEATQLKKDLAKSKKSEEQSKPRRERLTAEIMALKDERRKLKLDLQNARNALNNSDKPNAAKVEELRAQNERLKEELKESNRKLQVAEVDLEFIRGIYQTATREGGQRLKEMEELRREKEELLVKADMRAVELRKLQYDNQAKVKDQQIEKLKSQLSEREERIRRLEMERSSLGGYKGGRPVGTRSTSVTGKPSPSTSRTSSPGPGGSAAGGNQREGRENQGRPVHAPNNSRRGGNKE